MWNTIVCADSGGVFKGCHWIEANNNANRETSEYETSANTQEMNDGGRTESKTKKNILQFIWIIGNESKKSHWMTEQNTNASREKKKKSCVINGFHFALCVYLYTYIFTIAEEAMLNNKQRQEME